MFIGREVTQKWLVFVVVAAATASFVELWVRSIWRQCPDVDNTHLEDCSWALSFNIADTNNDFVKSHSNILSLWLPTNLIPLHSVDENKEKLEALRQNCALSNCIKVLVQNPSLLPTQSALKWLLLGLRPLPISVESFNLWFMYASILHLKQ